MGIPQGECANTRGPETLRRSGTEATRVPLKPCCRCSVLIIWMPNFTKGESYERGNNCWRCKKSQWMVDALGHSDVYLWNSSHQPASGVVDWNCHPACLVNSVRGNFTSNLCLSFSQHWRISLADPARPDLWGCRNLYADEPAFGRALSNTGPGGVSSRRRNLGDGS